MRNARGTFMEVLEELASKDDRIILVTCDVGFSYLEEFAKKYPNQYLNAGVTEQSAMGLCAGLASVGWKPYFYSMCNFVTMRNYEQLRNDVCHNNANVKILGVRGSVHYKFLGFSHNLYPENEDELILKHLPNLHLEFPETPDDVRRAVSAAYCIEGPVYIRL